MKNNKKFLFFTVALIVLLVGLGAVSATGVSDNSTSQSTHTGTSIASGDVQVTSSDTTFNKVEKTSSVKDIKTDKEIKKDEQTTKVDKTQSVSDYSSLEKSWNDIQSNGDNETDYVINVRNGEYDFTDELTTGNATPKSVTVNGEDVDKTIFNGNGISRFFNLNSSSQNIKFTNITFINGLGNSTGGAIYSNATLDIDSCKFINNSVINNKTAVQGGALKTIGNTTITNSSFINNTARIADVTTMRAAYGGAISHAIKNHYSILNITLCEFIGNREYTDNTASSFGGYGGAVYCLDRSSSYITYSTFINNTAVSQGGAIYLNKIYNDTPCIISNNYFESNKASTNNDTYHSWQGDISNSIFSSNYQVTTPKENKIKLLANDKLPSLTVTQKTNRLTIKLINEDKFEDAAIDGIGKNYEASITSNSNLINTSNLSLSRDNHYTATINLTSLPAGHEDIVLYVDGVECAVIKWDYTNVVFNNISSKPGENITLNATFTTSDNKLIPDGLVAFKINGKTIGHSNIKVGTASLNYTIPDNYSIKDYTLTVTYGGSSKFIGTQANSTLTLNKYDAIMTLDNVSANPGDNVLFRVHITSPNNTPVTSGKVVFKLNGKTLKDNNGNSTIRVHNGTAVLNYTIPSNYSAKNYKLSAVSVGNNYNRVEANSNLTLNKLNTYIRVNNITLNGNSLKVNATINNIKTGNIASERSNKVSVKIDKHTVIKEAKVNNGIINLNTTVNTRNGVHTVEIVTSGNNIYNSARVNSTVQKTSNLKQAIKKQDAVSSYYVSADNGSDTNTGSQTSPFKTIAHAISVVNSTKSSANIYLNGTFKGKDNTNLTVPGDLHINFIGVGNSSIDGEVNYTIKEKLDDGEYYWNSGRIWWPYNNGTGNWAMNITKGNGLITISNLTIKNCWSPGGSSIEAYPTATIDNYANLNVNNVSFIFNHAGVGSAIRNNHDATVIVNNSYFEGNRKSSSTGNDGIIYNNGTAEIYNSLFDKNYARWGTVLNDHHLKIINSTLQNGIGYDGGSSYKFGSGIAINTASADYFNNYNINDIITVIDGCTFINNDQLDVYADAGNLNLTNNIFNRSTGVNVPRQATNYTIKYNIVNNTFISPIGSTLFNSLSSTEKITFALKIQNAYSYNIENNTILNVTGTYSKSIELRGTANINYATIKNNIVDREIYVEGEYNNITGNNVTTKVDTYAVNLADGGNNTVRGNYLVSKSFQGDNAVNYTQSSTVVENNTPETKMITIDDSTYNRYFENNTLKANYNSIEQIQVVGSLTNKNFTFNRNINFFQIDKKITSYNITVTSNGQIESTGLIIENTNHEPVYILNTNGNKISNTKLKTNNNHTIIITGTNNTVTGNELVADMLVGNESVETVNGNNVTGNTPTYINYILSEDTYSNYFDENGYIRTLNNTRDIHFLVKGPVTNKNINLNNNKTVTITGYDNSILYNTTITTFGTTSLNMTYITVNNTNSKPAVILNTPVNTISNNSIITSTNAIEVNNATGLTIEYNNITANSTDIVKTIVLKDSKGTLNIRYNNINTTGLAAEITNTTSSIEILNTSQLVLSDNNITTAYTRTTGNDTIISVNLVNPEINITDLDTTGTNYNELADNNIYTYGNTNAVGINYVNQTVYTDDGTITTEAENNAIGTRFVSSKARHYYRYGSITTYGLEDITFKSNSPGSQIVLINSQNMRIYNNDITTSSNTTNGIILYNTVNTTIQNNRINTPATPVELDNSTQTNITGNVIITTSKYSIIIENTSTKNIVTGNILYAADELSDNSVAKLNSNNRVRLNNPSSTDTYLYLRDDTYNDYFDENGRLKDIVPTGTTLRLTGDLHDKVLNITRPINIISDNTEYIDCVMIIDEKATGTNITGARFSGENPRVIVNSNNSNLNIVNLIASNTKSSNLTPLTVNGNNNNIRITSTIAVYSTSFDLNSNATLMTVNGNNNYINTNYNRAENVNNVTIILLNNTENNTIKMSWLNTDPNIYNQAVFINSNYNKLNITQADVRGKIFTGINMENSSYNKFGYTRMNGAATDSTQILIMKNSDNNYFEELNAFKTWGDTIQNTPVRLENSNNNTFYRCQIQYTTYNGYAMIINESVGNLVEYNQLETRTLKGDDTVLQENVNDSINNIVRYNYAKAGRTPVFTVNTTDIIKVLDTITITSNATYRNGTSYRLPLIPVTQGTVTYKVNGVEIGTVDVTDGLTSINYTVTGNEGSTLQIEATYKDPTQTLSLRIATITRNITKINTNILVGNITNNGRDAILTAIVTDENKNIVNSGSVVFKVNGKTVGKTSITNGVALLVIDVSKYNAGIQNITATYATNNIYNTVTDNGILTINKYNATLTVDSVNAKPGETVLLRAHLTDTNGNPINSGKVVFKLNGKTLKDANGNPITVRVHNGEALLNYTIPSSYSAKNYTITAVSVGNTYNKVNATSNIVLSKIDSYITGSAVITGNTLIVNSSIHNSLTSNVASERSCKVSVKLDGHTVIKEVRISNGVINLNTTLSNIKYGVHNVEIVTSGNSIYNNNRINMTVVKV